MPPDPDVDYLTIGGGNSNLYMFSRTDTILLGGTFKLGDYSRNPEPEETERIVTEHQRIFSRLRLIRSDSVSGALKPDTPEHYSELPALSLLCAAVWVGRISGPVSKAVHRSS